MKLQNQLIYSIICVSALFLSACMALPINVALMERASELTIGFLALICFSITIIACACCHRNKSGFKLSQIKDRKEFENENTLADQTNSISRSEFPIFRAISPQIIGQQPISISNANPTDNNLDNRILSNIVNQNHMNRTFNEFENNQNNNGPISTVDLENIQNNNAVDYIPNRNEINIIVEPSPNSINRNLMAERSQHQQHQQQLNNNDIQSMPILMNSIENVINRTNYAPHLQTPYRIPSNNYGHSSETFVGHIDQLDINYALHQPSNVTNEKLQQNACKINAKDGAHCLSLNTDYGSVMDNNVQTPILMKNVWHVERRSQFQSYDIGMENNLNNDYDAISVEEALRALDFAISGGESLLSDYQDDDDDSDYSKNESDIDENDEAPQTIIIDNNESTKTELNKTIDAKDTLIIDNVNVEHLDLLRDIDVEVYELAKALVDDVLDKCVQSISLMAKMEPIANIEIETQPNFTPETNVTTTVIYEQTIDIPVNLNDSLDETFGLGKMAASTPCHKADTNEYHANKKTVANLFQTLDEVNESNLSDIEVLETTQPILVDATFEMGSNDNKLAATFVKPDDQTFVAPNQLQQTYDADSNDHNNKSNPTIRIDKEEVISDDLTTITPMNTPIELNYVGESWDLFVSKSQKMNKSQLEKNQTLATNTETESSTSNNAWFLHPQANITYDMDDMDYSQYDGNDGDSESIEENPELLSLTFDALRKQLADSLPHASVRPSVEYSDDDDNENSDSDHENDSLEYQPKDKYESLQSEVVINYYKQQLSPILEESEDETCKTFVVNETKCLDSTSTGCIETSEAIMGVTKVLMASNDTLFNFEDTLGDRDDMFSPRTLPNSGCNTLTANTPQPINCRTPTNEMYLNVTTTIEQKLPEHSMDEMRPTLLPLMFENPLSTMNDLLSPEQQKTFSEEINTVEQLSSDLSATIDATTNTLDDLKTCISVHLNDDSEHLENNAIETVQNNLNDTNDTNKNGFNVTIYEQNIHETEHSSRFKDEYDNGSVPNDDSAMESGSPEPAESAKENTNPNSTIENIVDADAKLNFNKCHDSNIISIKNINKTIVSSHETMSICEIDTQNEQNCWLTSVELAGQLSGEEDPWATQTLSDIRFNGPSSDDMNRTSFASNDWDSDIEDSNSSEEFMYAKGESEITKYLKSTKIESETSNETEFTKRNDDKSIECKNNVESGDEQPDAHGIWNSHDDLIAVSNNDADSVGDALNESSISENEDEWIPSSWDSLAKPSRSALKSPDKSSSKSSTKGRRNVVFKQQNHQSVYEYPKENALSPTYSEPQTTWSQYLANSSPYSSSTSDSYMADNDSNGASYVDFNALDGFAVSSSSRPFHGSQFNAECHTWPTDSEFSWSQVQGDIDGTNSDKTNYTSEPMDWQLKINKGLNRIGNNVQAQDTYNDKNNRPDSGVGESAELISDTMSLGDLRHTKALLRLPLNSFTAPAAKEIILPKSTNEQNEQLNSIKLNNINQDLSDNNLLTSDSIDSIVPTSCTGSMDSINSFDGVKNQQNSICSTNSDGLMNNNTTEMTLKNIQNETNIDDVSQNDITIHRRHQSMHNDINTNKKCDLRSSANRQSDSTDEDSGIENIVRIAKEI